MRKGGCGGVRSRQIKRKEGDMRSVAGARQVRYFCGVLAGHLVAKGPVWSGANSAGRQIIG